jgi:hypothetical protein
MAQSAGATDIVTGECAGEEPTAYTYKKAARDFILEKTGWSDYVRTKIKVGSLYNVIRQRKYVANAVGFEDGNLFATEL